MSFLFYDYILKINFMYLLSFQTEKYYINWCRTIEVNIPLCYKCIKKYTLTIEDLDKNKIKYQSNE